MTDAKDRAAGCLFGLALGDALGAKTEFIHDVRAVRPKRANQAGGRPGAGD